MTVKHLCKWYYSLDNGQTWQPVRDEFIDQTLNQYLVLRDKFCAEPFGVDFSSSVHRIIYSKDETKFDKEK